VNVLRRVYLLRQRFRLGGPLLLSILVHVLVVWGIGAWVVAGPGEVEVLVVELKGAAAEVVPQVVADAPQPVARALPEPRTVSAPEPLERLPREPEAQPVESDAPGAATKQAAEQSASLKPPAPVVREAEPVQRARLRSRYLSEITTLIEQHKAYPLMARKMRQQGTVNVLFRLNRRGGLLECSIAGSSGYRALDRAALTALEAVEHFPPAPDILGDELQFLVAIVFTLN